MSANTEPGGFGAFFQQYTKTWMHAVATAGLTAFGLLSFVHRGFVVLALACYIVPPIVLYVSRSRGESTGESTSPTEAALSDWEDTSSPEREPEPTTEPRPEADAERDPASAAETEPEPARPAGPESTAEQEPEPDPESERERDPTTERDREPAAERRRKPATGAEPDGESSETASEPDPDDEPDETDAEPRWRRVDSPTDAALLDVAVADSSAVAAGEDGIVLEREPDSDWTVVLEDGPAAQRQTLHGVDTTDDGAVAWVAGDGGAVGRLEAGSGRHTDYSAPDDRTSNLAGIAVAGSSDDETVLVINGSGEVLRGRYRDGDLDWAEPVKPGSGSSLSDATLVDASVGYCCDTNDGVFETDDGGQTFETVGLEGADGTLTGIAAGDRGNCHVSTDAGVVHRYDGSTWTPERVCDAGLSDVSRAGDRLAVCTADGAIYERDGPAADWERADADSSVGLEAISAGDELTVAVGSEGTVIERR